MRAGALCGASSLVDSLGLSFSARADTRLSEGPRRIERLLAAISGVVNSRKGGALDVCDRSHPAGGLQYFSTTAPG